MPHRVATFFRSHSHPLDLAADIPRSKSHPSSGKHSPLFRRSPNNSTSSLVEDRNSKMLHHHDSAHKRLSLTGMTHAHAHSHSHSPKSSQKSLVHAPATLNCIIESPPLVFYGPATSSTGALLSGQLMLDIADEHFAIEDFQMRLVTEVHRKRPFHAHCPECSYQETDLTTWKFLATPAVLQKGEHQFPFSFLLPGNLPATMKGSLCSIDYVLKATITPKSGEPLRLSQTLDIKRAICPPDSPRHSIRIFPPTNLTANCELPPIVHPIGEFNMSMRIDGVVNRNVDAKNQTQWRLKRVSWRIEETQKTVAPACAKHLAKLGTGPDVKKSTAYQDTRIVGQDELKTGWKADYTTPDGSIDMEFPFSISPSAHAVCDMKSADGNEVSHVLIVEMIVAEEFAPLKKPNQVAPTGAARVLRMHFNLTLTERSGLGISWDEEQPPLYENVPASPPAYGNAEIYDGEPIPDYEELRLDPESRSATPGTPAGRASVDRQS
ncbi:hypothetical protein F5884DRAFT_523463 [Xylogone sp. PMI_703]|nr:hypothetical protein F5884DRAFT_523463 [Xylogone sp. PMI_703]